MEKSIKPGDWVRSIERSKYETNDIQCRVGEVRQVASVHGESIIFSGNELNGCLMRRFEKINIKSFRFCNLYEKLSN